MTGVQTCALPICHRSRPNRCRPRLLTTVRIPHALIDASPGAGAHLLHQPATNRRKSIGGATEDAPTRAVFLHPAYASLARDFGAGRDQYEARLASDPAPEGIDLRRGIQPRPEATRATIRDRIPMQDPNAADSGFPETATQQTAKIRRWSSDARTAQPSPTPALTAPPWLTTSSASPTPSIGTPRKARLHRPLYRFLFNSPI